MPRPHRVLIFNGTEDATAVDPMVAYWSQSTQFITVASKVEETGLTPIEDDDDVFCYDISLLRHSYDVLIVVATSTAPQRARRAAARRSQQCLA